MKDREVDPFDLRTLGRLRFHGQSPLGIADLKTLINTIDSSYAHLCFHAARVQLALDVAAHLDSDLIVRRALELRLHDEKVVSSSEPPPWFTTLASVMGPVQGHPITLNRVRLESPGFWEFAGSLNPLAQMREYLIDRHERRKDMHYRNDAERRVLEAEARLKELEVERAELELVQSTYEVAARMVGAEDARKLAARSFGALGDAVIAAAGDDVDARPQLMP